MTIAEISVRAEYTPNPNSLKFICSEVIYPYSNSLSYLTVDEAKNVSNKLAEKLFAVNGIRKVFIMNNFVTVDKSEEINWKDIHLDIKDVIKTSLADIKDWAEANKPEIPETNLEDGDVRARIETVLNKIRPALVADGGNIELVDIINKDARLRMVGACGTCPSSLMTMKMGVERALLAEVPDIVESVTQVY
ncbi:MAG: NifU family protein [Candidatus Caenarcaniphilales bacterium]|jgi:Fe-S cluster biogenesis protein NfuA|nr:NifU family protein [Candidatus Caenarcaniphilales bacterium]